MKEGFIVAETANSLMVPALILFVGVLASKLSEIIKIPDIVIYLFAGVLIGPAVLNLVNVDTHSGANQFILTFGAAFILYDGGREIKLKILNDVKWTVGLLASLGVFISAISIGFVAMNVFHIEFIYAFLIGSVIASTDPAALVPVFSKIKIVDRVKQTVISESAFNDAVGAILVLTIITIIQSGKFSIEENAISLIKMIVFGVVSGTLMGFIFSLSVSDGKFGLFTEFAPIISILAVMISYSLAESFGGSGYMSTFMTGLICGNKKVLHLWVPTVDFEVQKNVRDTVTAIMKIAIFILLGMHVDFNSLLLYWKESMLIVLALVFVVRPLSVLICTLPDRKVKWHKNEILFMMWVRETGVIPAALSGLVVSLKIPNANMVSSVVFMTILFTLLIQATTARLLASKLGLILPDAQEKRPIPFSELK
ncbi:cation:proton antiporter [Fusibacter ferrireducens]|uniref:Cation:proton antiporter n=1 Tax=Fusibacter ferrireducens TaxID=2785058 RepID=A0ABR9ZZA2_9FIRM|nr:cation:proton antiporter [Fusibacter ferrireducens]MBF4695786.1 cation:proton antiporter [Fusibacter ferrireducens]